MPTLHRDLNRRTGLRARMPLWHRLVLLLLIAAPLAADAQWVWRDKEGRVNASDRPPPSSVPDKDITSRPVESRRALLPQAAASAASAAAAADAAVRPLEAEVQARRRATEQEQAAKTKADDDKLAANRAENCRRARNHAAALDSGQRLARMNDKGEREVLDDKGRADEMRRAREVIASDCR